MLPPDFIAQLTAAYPRRRGDQGWGAVKRLVPRAIADGATFEQLLEGAKNYAQFCQAEGKVGTETVKMAATFFGRDCWWQEWQERYRTPAEVAQDARWAALETRAIRLGFTTVDRQRGYDVALRAVEQAERENERKVVDRAGLKLRVVG